ncbi:hypothetical protein QBK99_15460 [Corticibacterium sp. UT-5YL-CI-8]|nr:hypothetical protein [Tianweitania sp. UT-5YL-CI-8]
MTAVTNELIYEILKSLQGDIRQLKDGQAEIRHELIAIRSQLISINQDISNIYGVLGRHELRLDRIERRLELREFAETQNPFENNT